MNQLIEIRLPICQSCEHFDPTTNSCQEVKRRAKVPGKLGHIFHEAGIPNPTTECPIGKFLFVPGLQVTHVTKKLPFLSRETVRYLNKMDLKKLNTFLMAIRLQPVVRKNKPRMKLSTIKGILDDAAKLPHTWDESTLDQTIPKEPT